MIETQSAVLSRTLSEAPYAQSRPLEFETLLLDDPGPGEVLVRVAAASLCHSDLSVINGSRPRPLPMVLGHEGSGVVVDTGTGVIGFAPGDHVVFSFVPSCGTCKFCLSGRPALCLPAAAANTAGTLLSGERRFSRPDGTPVNHHLGVSCFSEHTVVNASSIVKVDPTIDLSVAALFGCALLTGAGAVINTAGVEPGASVAVFGLGGVGMATILGARIAGANPIIAVDPVESKHAIALEHGATHALVPGDDTADEIRAITGGGADYAFEAVGSTKVLAAAYAATGRGGSTVAIGLPHPDHRLELPAVSIVAEERQILGSYMGSAVPVRDVTRMVNLYQADRLPVAGLLSATIRPDQINEGFDEMEAGHVMRQVVRFPD